MGARPAGLFLLLALLPPRLAAADNTLPPKINNEVLKVVADQLKPYFHDEAGEVAVLNLIQVYPKRQEFIDGFADFLQKQSLQGDAGHGEHPGWHRGDELGTNNNLNQADRDAVIRIVSHGYDDFILGKVTPLPPAPNAAAVSNGAPVPHTQETPPGPTAKIAPMSTREAVLVNLAGAQDRNSPAYSHLTEQAAQDAAARGDFLTAYNRFAAIPQGNAPNPDALIGMSNAAYESGNYAQARDDAARALKIRPGDRAALSLYYLSDSRAPRADLKSAAAGFGGLASAEGFTGVAAGGGASTASNAPAGVPSSAALAAKALTQVQAAMLALRIRDNAAAAEHASRALEFDPNDSRALEYRAIAEGRLGRYADAERDASAALALNPGSLTALGARLWARGRQGKWREALSDADAFIAAAPMSPDAHYSRAFALAGLGDKAGALAELRRAAELDAARYGAKYAAAAQLPDKEDLSLLFAGEFGQPGPVPPARRGISTATVVATSGAVLLILLAVLLVFYPQKLETLRRLRLAPALAPMRAGDALQGRYRLGRKIGAGGMGVVYEATDLSLNRRVALKKIRDESRLDASARSRFLDEARSVARLKHPNIVDIYAVFEESGETCLAFEFVEGRTLHELIAAEGPLEYAAALKLFRPMCAAVACAHAGGIFHRDLKPANVMVTPDGTVKVMDFGVARRVAEAGARTMTQMVVGTPPYMAPEQEQGQVRRESDNYALAVCFYEMTVGRLPFAGTGAGLTLNKLGGKILPASGKFPLPPGFDEAMKRALAPDPDARPRTPEELMAALQSLA
jgi:tetratricopeptide (TPR) repeat protein